MSMINKYINILIILGAISCSSVNLIKEPVTSIDEEKLANFTPENLQIKNKKLLVAGYSRLPLYKDVMTSQTVEIVSNAGGVEVVQLRDILSKERETKLLGTQLNKDVALNQKLGTDDGIYKEVKEANKGIDFGLVTRLKDARIEVTFIEEKCKETEKGLRCLGPYWITALDADVEYSLFDFKKGEDVVSGVTDHKYVKIFREEPSDSSYTVMMPRVLEYCYEDILPKVQAAIPLSTTVVAMKGEKNYALISAGSINKIQPGRVFEVKEGEETVASIDVFQVNQKESWGKVSGNREKLKIGMKAEIKPQTLSLGYRIFRWFYQRSGLNLKDLLD